MAEVLDLGSLAEMENGTARQVIVGDRKIALIRIGDDVYAIGDTCSHADVSLAEGEVLAADREIDAIRADVEKSGASHDH